MKIFRKLVFQLKCRIAEFRLSRLEKRIDKIKKRRQKEKGLTRDINQILRKFNNN